jgi:hypothetical protein
MDVATLVTVGATAAEAIKNAIGLARKANQAELERVLLDLRDDIATLRDANIELRNENRELREKLQTREELLWENDVYWKTDGSKKVGPFCPKCFAGSSVVSRMTDQLGDSFFRCPVCTYSSRKSAGRL